MAGPVTYIVGTLPLEELFVGPFVIWIGPEALPRRELFRGVRIHELLRLMGLRLSRIQQLLDAPWPEVLARMCCVPGSQVLAVMFV